MSIAARSAETVWEGLLASGHGALSSDSGSLDDLDVTWASRTQAPDGRTSPEELCAAAHSTCFAMALALTLGEQRVRPQRLDVRATVVLDEVGGVPTVVSSSVQVDARIAELDEGDFQALVAQAADLCPVSRLFAGAEVTVGADLTQG